MINKILNLNNVSNIIYGIFLIAAITLGYIISDLYNKRQIYNQQQYYNIQYISYKSKIDSLEKVILKQKVRLDFKYTTNQKEKIIIISKNNTQKRKKEYETYMALDTNAKVRYFSSWLRDSTRSHFERLSKVIE